MGEGELPQTFPDQEAGGFRLSRAAAASRDAARCLALHRTNRNEESYLNRPMSVERGQGLRVL